MSRPQDIKPVSQHSESSDGLNFQKGYDARGREVHKASSSKGLNYSIEKMKTPGDVIYKTGKPSTHVMKYSGKGIRVGAALHSSLEDAMADAQEHHIGYKSSQHEEETEDLRDTRQLNAAHVTSERARELVAENQYLPVSSQHAEKANTSTHFVGTFHHSKGNKHTFHDLLDRHAEDYKEGKNVTHFGIPKEGIRAFHKDAKASGFTHGDHYSVHDHY